MIRLGKIVFVVGIVLVISSVAIAPNEITNHATSRLDSPSGVIFRAVDEVWLEVSPAVGEGVFSMHVLHGAELNSTLSLNETIESANSIFEYADIEGYDGLLSLPGPGFYALVFTRTINESIRLDIRISPIRPTKRILIMGGLLLLIGIVPISVRKIRESRWKKNTDD